MSRKTAKILMLLVLAGGAIGLYFSPLREFLTREHIRGFVDRLRALWYGPFIFVAAYAIACVFFVPASLFVISAGLIWGWKFGALYAMTGGLLGAVASYFAGRFLGEGLLERFGRAGEIVSKQVSHAGFVSMLIARLIPGPPFALWNYAAGICRVSFSDYFFATLFGMLPSAVIFAYCADALFNGSMSQGDAVRKLATVGILLISLVVVSLILKRRVSLAK